jgi:CheY-like chemotaxis protein
MKLPVLVFDPEPVAAGVLSMQLRHAGFATDVASNGTAAIASAGRKKFAAIVVIADLTLRCGIACMGFAPPIRKHGSSSFQIPRWMAHA